MPIGKMVYFTSMDWYPVSTGKTSFLEHIKRFAFASFFKVLITLSIQCSMYILHLKGETNLVPSHLVIMDIISHVPVSREVVNFTLR